MQANSATLQDAQPPKHKEPQWGMKAEAACPQASETRSQITAWATLGEQHLPQHRAGRKRQDSTSSLSVSHSFPTETSPVLLPLPCSPPVLTFPRAPTFGMSSSLPPSPTSYGTSAMGRMPRIDAPLPPLMQEGRQQSGCLLLNHQRTRPVFLFMAIFISSSVAALPQGAQKGRVGWRGGAGSLGCSGVGAP